MRKANLLLWGGALLVTVGCSTPPETRTEEVEDKSGFVGWKTEDSFERTPESRKTTVLPLPPIERVRLNKLDPRVLEELRQCNRRAWEAYSADIDSASLDDAERDRICRRALEALVASRLATSKTPLSRKYAERGLQLVARDGRREHRFTVPGAKIRKLALKNRALPECRVVALYLERRDLYHDCLLDALRKCGLSRADVYWSALFTLLDLELRGIEEEYLKVIGFPGWD